MSNKPMSKDYTDKRQYNTDSMKWKYSNDPEHRAYIKSSSYNDTYTIYKITNSINDKIYIGSSKIKLKYRLTAHFIEASTRQGTSDFYVFMRSVATKDNFKDIFKIEPIETGISDKADAWKIEGEYIRNAGDKCFNQIPNSGKHNAHTKKYLYEDCYTVYEITNLYDDTVYVGVTHKKLNVVLAGHKTYAFTMNRKYRFYNFIRSASNHMNFYLVFSIKALQENIPDLDMATEIKESILQNYAEMGKPTFNSNFTKKYFK